MDYYRGSIYIKAVNCKLTLLAIFFLGVFLRIYHLGDESIWLDEAFSIKLASSSLFGIIEGSAEDPHPPLYYILLHYWINLFGNSEFSTRFLSVVFGFLSILMSYKVGSLIFDKETGVLSALILALSTFHIHYSQEARMYSLMTLLTLLSVYFFIRLLRGRSILVSTGYLLSSILLIYTHIYGLFIIMAQNIYVFTLFLLSKEHYELNYKRWITLQILLIVLFSPWIKILINQMLMVQSDFWIPAPPVTKLIGPFITYSGSKPLFLLFLMLSIFSVVGYKKLGVNADWKVLFRSIKGFRLDFGSSSVAGVYLILLWILTPIILPFIISRVSTPVYITRYTIGASVAFYLLAAKGVRDINHENFKSAVIALIIVLSSLNIWGYYHSVNKEQWRDIANYLDSSAGVEDLVLFNAGYNQRPFDYYSRRADLVKKPFPEDASHVDEENIKELRLMVEGHDKVWLIQGYDKDDSGLIMKMLGESHNLAYHKEYLSESYATGKSISIWVYLFQKK